MGPVLILDKSAFQSFSKREHFILDVYFLQNITPILGLELLGDLRKEGQGSRTADDIVKDLARKFGGSGGPTNIDYRALCLSSLFGHRVPLIGKVLPQASQTFRDSDGCLGMMVDLSPLNQAIMRWQSGQFAEFERDFAGYWRQVTRNLDLDSFLSQLDSNSIILPKAKHIVELSRHVDALLANSALQDVWLTWLLAQLSLPRHYETTITKRWAASHHQFIEHFAPYAWYCLRVMLLLAGGMRHQLVSGNPTNLLDIQYLFYLPFCMVFVSDDRVHRALAPGLLRPDQSFVTGQALKADLKRLAQHRAGLLEQERERLNYALGCYPPPSRDSVVHELWKKHMAPWRPSSVNHAAALPIGEREEAVRTVRQMFLEVEGETYFSTDTSLS